MTPPPAAFRLPPVACLLAVALALLASGCGEDGTARPESATAQPPASAKAGTEAHRTAAAGCPGRLDAFLDSLDALRRELVVGLSYDDYVERVKDLRASHRAIPVRRLTIDCLATGTPGERALNEHIDAANAWGECLADASCTTATIEPVLQRRWRNASRFLSQSH
jgi:hypothetical protein